MTVLLCLLLVFCVTCSLMFSFAEPSINMTSVKNGAGDTEMKFTGIYKSLDAVKKCLYSEKYFNLPEVQELLRIFSDNFSVINDEVVERSQRKVFIVLEGIDASGKTTISKKLARIIDGEQLVTPPDMIANLREKFDNHETELRRAYYALGNYLAAQQVKQRYKMQPVIMDRYWHSTASYVIAQQSVDNYNSTVPPEGHEVYEWPSDLLKPDLVFFLAVSESKRLDRLLRRKNKSITREELRMKDNKPLREALSHTFLRMRNPGVKQINADYYPNTVIKACMNTLISERLVQVENPEKYQLTNYSTTLKN